jgi:hypothetical protein
MGARHGHTSSERRWRLARLALALLAAFGPLLSGGPAVPIVQAATLGYGHSFGTDGINNAQAVVLDPNGNAYLAGFFTGTVDFGPGTAPTSLTSAGGSQDAFVAKLDPSGRLIWAHGFGDVNDDRADGITLDSAGNVYVTGLFQGTVDFDPGPSTFNLTSGGGSTGDGFILKLTSDGGFVWADALDGTGGAAEARVVTVDGTGNVDVVGDFVGTFDFDPGAGTTSLTSSGGGTGHTAFALKLGAGGSLIWARALGDGAQSFGLGMAADRAGNVTFTGRFSGPLDADPGPGTLTLNDVGGTDVYVEQLDANGTLAWAFGFGDALIDIGTAVAVDSGGNVYLTGAYAGTVDVDPGPATFTLTNGVRTGDLAVYVLKLDAGGHFVWARSIGQANNSVIGTAITLDGADNVYVAGHFGGAADFDPGPGTLTLTSADASSGFIVELDNGGSFLGAQQLAGTSIVTPNGIGIGRDGAIVVDGQYTGTIDFDPGAGVVSATSGGDRDIFVVKLVQGGAPVNSVPGSQTTAEDTPLTFSQAKGNRLSVSDANVNVSQLQVRQIATNGTLTLSGTSGLRFEEGDGNADASMTFTGTPAAINAALDGLTFTPSANFNGSASLQITSSDQTPDGAQTDSDTISIAVTPANDPPTAIADSYTVAAEALLTVPAPGVLANDADVDGPTPLLAGVVTGPAHGNLTLNLDGGFSYTPASGFGGTDSFAYQASDGAARSEPATVTIRVTSIRCTPRPRIQTNLTPGGTSLQVHVEATPLNTQQNNPLHELRFGPLQNPKVTLNGQSVASDQTVTIAPNTHAVDFTVERMTPGQATTVPFTVLDGCGLWPTFVGGGTSAQF